MKKAAILYTNYSPVIDAIKYQLSGYKIDCMKELEETKNYDLVILVNYSGTYSGEALRCHHSLLPAFDTNEPVKDAILSGVKVTGITIFFTKTKKIVAQYPVFISNLAHFDEVEQELEYIEQVLYPLVIEKVIEDKPFEVQTLLNKSCSGNCGGCSSCNY